MKRAMIVLIGVLMPVCALFAADPGQGRLSPAPVPQDCRVISHLGTGRSFLDESKTVHDVLATTYSNLFVFPNQHPQTGAIIGSRIELKGWFMPHEIKEGNGGKTATVVPPSSFANEYGGIQYQEMPNSTGFIGPKPTTGEPQEIVISRGILPYPNTITPRDGVFNSPQGYHSNLPAFRRNKKTGQLEYFDTLLKSSPENDFFFEDPRVSVIDDDQGRPIYLLSGTDYSPHVPGSKEKFIRNAFVELEFDPATGLPKPIPVDPVTKKPNFHYLSPAPVQIGEGSHVGIDAKNAVIARRGTDRKIVVRTRFRPDFKKDPTYLHYKKYFAEKEKKELLPWEYSEQAFVFDSYEDMKKYDWSHALEDLYVHDLGAPPRDTTSRIRPREATIMATENSFREFYPKDLLVPGKPQGFGPGTRPLQVTRKGDHLYVQDKPGDQAEYAGLIPSSFLEPGKFLLEDNQTIFISFDHKLRYLKVPTADGKETLAVKRVYSGTVKVWDASLTKILMTFDDAVQPTEAHQVGLSGILDLHHAGYFMGASILPHYDGKPSEPKAAVIRVYAGASDAHTESFDFSPLLLALELSPGSKARERGQAYVPAPVSLLRSLDPTP